MKKVSVVIPAYNKAKDTVGVVESVLNQTYKNIEIIVVDDGSSDNTRQLLCDYSDRIRYIYKDNGGACSARNVGIRLASGEYIGLLDCDDLYLPEKIELSVKFLEEHRDFGFVHSAAYFIDENDNILRKFSHRLSRRRRGSMAKDLLFRDFICNSTVVVRKSCFAKVGLFDEEIFTPGDWDMWLRLAENYKAGYIDRPLVSYRVSSSYNFNHVGQVRREELVVLKKSFARNKELSLDFKNKAVSNLYYRCALSYILVGNFQKAKEELSLAIDKNKFNLILRALLVYCILAPKNLQFLVKRKVFNNFGL